MVKILLSCLLLGVCSLSVAQKEILLSGTIKDSSTYEVLIGAHISLTSPTGKQKNTISNIQGHFRLTATNGDSLKITFIGYEPKKLVVNKILEEKNSYLLEQQTEYLDVVSVQGNNQNAQHNFQRLRGRDIQLNPVIGSVPDVIKSIEQLPGFTAQNEASSHLIVRGSLSGQNQYRIDGIPLTYVHHLGGFFSVFNPEMINTIDIYKSGFPSRYGGKVSSLINITQKEGNTKDHKSKLTLSPLISSFTLNGPLGQGDWTYFLSLRKTLIDPLMAGVSSLSRANDFTVSYGFHDVNSKVTYHVNDQSTLSFIVYHGDDYLNHWSGGEDSPSKIKSRMQTVWGNWMIGSKWQHYLSKRFYTDICLSYTHYRLKYKNQYYDYNQADSALINNRYSSSLSEIRAQNHYEYSLDDNISIFIGGELYQRSFSPNQINNAEGEFISTSHFEPYAEFNTEFLKHSFITAGVRYYYYQNNDYKRTDWSPRFTVGFGLSDKQHLKINLERLYQYDHMLFTTGFIANNEIWFPADQEFSPTQMAQFSLSYVQKDLLGFLNLDITAYSRNSTNVLTYKDGYNNLFGDPNWRNKVASNGTASSTGIELLLDKKTNSYSAQLAYTLSQTVYKFPEVNDGFQYPFEFDRPHMMNLSFSKPLSDKLDLSIAWTYQTGLPFTPAIGKRLSPSVNGEFKEVLMYGERNSARLRDYHRLDAGLTYRKLSKKGRPVEWRFSIYNVYNRLNSYTNFYHYTDSDQYLFDLDFNGKSINLYQKTFFPIIPSFSYTIYFDQHK
ncbi:carboxypeptidase-like regulatory domain-containing protein [Marivirga sp.]|uniref:TonB-dependent receptor n=1 Tax=Marivirga sp. TaxID=2018662 RepID=UPI0025E184A5|nr:carboxypeptidase-like regulatory domain-containing protein [Marivirga sp.]